MVLNFYLEGQGDQLVAKDGPVDTYYLDINSALFHSQKDPSLDDKLCGHLIYGELGPDMLLQ